MGADRSGRFPEVGARLISPPAPSRTSPPIGRVYGRRRSRLPERKIDSLGDGLAGLSIAIPEAPSLLDPARLFAGSPREVWLEIGFGGGEHLAALAQAHPDIGFIGCEPFLNGVSNLVALIQTGGLTNIRVVPDDARLLLQALEEGSIARAFVLFADPWPKRRHEGRRFLSSQGLDLIARALADNGELRVATDHPLLKEWTAGVMAERLDFRLIETLEARPADWPPTRYEAKAIKAGRAPRYFRYERAPRDMTA